MALEEARVDYKSTGVAYSLREILKIREIGPLAAIILLVIAMGFLQPRFFLAINLMNVARQISLLSMIAIGMSYCLISGEFDLSVGSTFGLSAIFSALIVTAGYNPLLAILVSLLTGIAIGTFNGVLVAKLAIPSFVVTLGTMSMGRGIALTITKGWPISIYGTKVPSWFLFLGGGRAFDVIPMQAIFMAVSLIIGHIILHKTRYGYHLFSVGGNPRAAMLYGISVARVKIYAFMITGFLASLAGILAFSFVQTGEPNMGTLMELEVIAAAVIGGTAIKGGQGSILGVLLGAMTIGIINNGLVLMGVSPFIQKIVMGCVIISAVYFGERVLKVRGKE
jgi:ribose/xylose/arabinose/galactoside ABC-type transport system permease subunit